MDVPFSAIAFYVAVLLLPALFRVVRGPTLFDRLIGAGLIGTNGVLLLALFGFTYQRIEMFVDLAIVYALLNFIGAIAAGKYFERRRGQAP